MVSSKLGTQNWSKAVQPHDFKNDNAHYTPASAGSGDDKNIGEKLNQIANPGGKDPTKQARKAHNTLDKDDFMKLMLTQMKNQDPMSPLQSHEMAAQLAQFTSLEQLFNVNKNLEGLGKAQDPIQKYEALNFLGKTVKSDTREVLRTTGDTTSDLRFSLGADALKGKLTIMDDQGQVVKTMDLGNLKAGANKIVWSGGDAQDRDVKPGHYIFSVEAENAAGHKIGVQTATHGTITGVNYTAEGPMLMIGDQKIRLQDVQKIEDESLKEKQNAGESHILAPQVSTGDVATVVDAAKSQQMTPQQVNNQLTGQQVGQQVAKKPMRVKPEDKPEAKLTGAVIPLEVASSNATGAGHLGGAGISTGGAFAHK